MNDIRKRMIDNIDMPDISTVYYDLSSLQKIGNCISDVLKRTDNDAVFEEIVESKLFSTIYFHVKGMKYNFECRIVILKDKDYKGNFGIKFLIDDLTDLSSKSVSNFNVLVRNDILLQFDNYFYSFIYLFPGNVDKYLHFHSNIDDLTDICALVDLNTIQDIKDILRIITERVLPDIEKEDIIKHPSRLYKYFPKYLCSKRFLYIQNIEK